jgi:hypothetical protein
MAEQREDNPFYAGIFQIKRMAEQSEDNPFYAGIFQNVKTLTTRSTS